MGDAKSVDSGPDRFQAIDWSPSSRPGDADSISNIQVKLGMKEFGCETPMQLLRKEISQPPPVIRRGVKILS